MLAVLLVGRDDSGPERVVARDGLELRGSTANLCRRLGCGLHGLVDLRHDLLGQVHRHADGVHRDHLTFRSLPVSNAIAPSSRQMPADSLRCACQASYRPEGSMSARRVPDMAKGRVGEPRRAAS